MYQFFLTIQYVGITLLFFLMIYTLYQKASKNQQLLLIFTISALLNDIGYLKELRATTYDSALEASKLTYIGKVYIILSMFFFILNYCRIHHSKAFSISLIMIHTAILILVLTCEQHTLFYRDIRFCYDGYFPHMEFDYGPGYYLFCILSFTYVIIIQLSCAKRLRETKDHLQRVQLWHLLYITFVAIMGFACYQTGITHYYDATSISYMIGTLILIVSTFQFNLLHTVEIAKESVVDNLSNGIIIVDNADSILYLNAPASAIYPELSSMDTSKNYSYILDRLKQYEANHEHLFCDDQVYSIAKKPITYRGKTLGMTYAFINVTASYNYTQILEDDVYAKNRKIQFIQHALITSFANMVEARDGLTGMHIKRTSEYVRIIASYLANGENYAHLFTDKYIENIINAAPLHDIGKIAIPDAILKKPGSLTKDEFEIIKTHSETGAKMIEEILDEVHDDECLSLAKDMAYYHHERWDGKGYPCNLRGGDIPLCARIMAVADVYDALRSKRCYKDRIPAQEAYDIIINGSGTQFDPMVVHAFADVFDQIQAVD